MNKKHKKKILLKLQTAINNVEMDPEKHDGDTVKARANQIATRVNVLHPHSDLFDESFKRKMLTYMTTGRAAEEGDTTMMVKLEALNEPTDVLILETLNKMIKKLG